MSHPSPVTSSTQTARAQRTPAGDSDIRARIDQVVAEQLGVALEEVTPEAHILDDLGADSLDVVELVMSLEEAFDLEIPDSDVEVMRTIADVQKYVLLRLQNAVA